MSAPTLLASDAGPLPNGAFGSVRPSLRQPVGHFFTRHLNMRDGTRIAIDVHLPHEARSGAPVPTVLHQTRYFRATALRPPFSWAFGPTFQGSADGTRARFLSNGYAWIDVDVRGSGASFGMRPHPWSRDEVSDGAEVLDWIVKQDWSNGRVGSTGVSYAGTAAEFLATTGHPALAAIAPRFSLFDVYTDIAFPGGVHLSWFTERWGELNGLIDQNRYGTAFGEAIRMLVQALRPFTVREGPRWLDLLARGLDHDMAQAVLAAGMGLASPGVRPVEGDRSGDLVARATVDHRANFDVHAEALAITHRDDPAPSPPRESLDIFSPHLRRHELAAAGIPVLNMSGWMDGAYPHSAIKRFHGVASPGSRLVLGPWEHGGKLHISAYAAHRGSRFDQDAELVSFFDLHVKADPSARAATHPVHYFTMGEERWKSSTHWPPPEATIEPWFLGDRCSLIAREAPPGAGTDEHALDVDVGTGPQSRWNCLVGTLPRVGYPDRRERDRHLLCYDSAPLQRAVEVTGHPVLRLFLRSTATDGTFFAYLEDVTPDGRVHYVTEGMLRARHRRVSDATPPYPVVVPHRSYERADAAEMVPGEITEMLFDLLPVSHRFDARHSIRLAIAGADRDHFAKLDGPAPEIEIHRGGVHASHLALPVVPLR